MNHLWRKQLGACLLIGALLGTVGVWAEGNPPTPHELPGGTVIQVSDLKALAAKTKLHVFDMRSAVNYGRGHIPGALPLPYKERSAAQPDFDPRQDDFDLGALPTDKASLIVFYSHGETGWKSYKAAVAAIRSGYTRVFWLRSGLSAWQSAGEEVAR